MYRVVLGVVSEWVIGFCRCCCFCVDLDLALYSLDSLLSRMGMYIDIANRDMLMRASDCMMFSVIWVIGDSLGV